MEPWRRNFRAVWPSLFVVSAGMMAFVPMLPLYVRERFALDESATQWWSGLIYGAAPLSAAVAGPAWGVLGDRRGRKPMALRALFGIAAIVALMPWATSPLQLLLLRVVQGSLAGYVAPAMALVSSGLPPQRQGRTLGNLQVAMALGMLCGPFLGAELAARVSLTAVFRATALLALLSAIPVLLFAREAPREVADGPGEVAPLGFRSSLRAFLTGRGVLALLGVVFLVRFAQMMSEAYLALWIDELGPLPWFDSGSVPVGDAATADAATAGAAIADAPSVDDSARADAVTRTLGQMLMVLALGQILFAGAWGRLGDRLGPLRALAILSVALGLLLIPSGLTGDSTTFFVLRCGVAAVLAGGMSLSYAAVAKRIDPRQRGLAFACVQSFMQLGMFAGPLVGAVLAEAAGLGAIFVGAGLSSLLAAASIVLLRAAERRRQLAMLTNPSG